MNEEEGEGGEAAAATAAWEKSVASEWGRHGRLGSLRLPSRSVAFWETSPWKRPGGLFKSELEQVSILSDSPC